MSIVITIKKNNKVYPENNYLLDCNICLQKKEYVQKCSNCEFYICNKCLLKWYKFDESCPHCKKILTYNEPISFKKKCNLFIDNKKNMLINIHNNIKYQSKRISRKIIKIFCSESVKNCLSETTTCCGLSLLLFFYALFASLSYLLIFLLLISIIIFFIYCICCCCSRQYNYQ